MITPGGRVKNVRIDLLKVSRDYLYKKYGLPVDTLAAWENNKLQLTQKGLDRCIKILNAEGLIVSREWILTGQGLDPKFSLDLSKYFRTLPAEVNDDYIDDQILRIKEVEFFKSLAPNSVVSVVSSDDMLPFFRTGDYVGGRFVTGRNIDNCIGKDSIIKTKDGGSYIRRLAKSPSNKGFNLVCLNPQWDGNPEPVIFGVEVELVAPIIWLRRQNS